jgi:ABC-type sugar transport system ATPase subunit
MDSTTVTPSEYAPRRPILATCGLGITFGGVQALDNLDFEIFGHEIVAVVGENAAGKSTLARILAGVYHPGSGQIRHNGQPVSLPDPAAARQLGIAMVHQNLALADNLDVTANLYLGQEMAHPFLNELEMEKTARQILTRIGARITSVKQLAGSLSGGQRQSIAIARAMLGDPKVVILDEPTASLSVAQTADVLEVVEHMRDMGKGVMLISHNLADVRAIADRIVVLRHGRVVGQAAIDDVSYEDIVAAITGASATLPVRPQSPAPRVALG